MGREIRKSIDRTSDDHIIMISWLFLFFIFVFYSDYDYNLFFPFLSSEAGFVMSRCLAASTPFHSGFGNITFDAQDE